MLIDGKVDPVAADAQWRANTRPRITPGARQPGEARATSPEAGVPAYEASRARQAAADAERAELDLLERRRELVSVASMERLFSKYMPAARDIALSMSARLAPVLAAETEQAKVAALIDEEVVRMLTELARIGDALEKKEL
ncbi:MAG: hypothetical protein ACK50Z_11725 [Betaproteobacteria bacterium]